MKFKTEEISLDFNSFDINLTVITNSYELFDALVEKGSDHEDVKDERIPYWAELWASAIAMSEYLIENQLVKTDTKVLEIGCGLGLPSIVAGKFGAKKVILTDYIQEALDFAKINWLQNLPLENVEFLKMDWRNPNSDLAADILIASDVAYEKRAFEPLLQSFKTLLKPNGRILISEPNRHISKTFFSGLHTEGYHVKHTEKIIERKEQKFTVNIYELIKTNNSIQPSHSSPNHPQNTVADSNNRDT